MSVILIKFCFYGVFFVRIRCYTIQTLSAAYKVEISPNAYKLFAAVRGEFAVFQAKARADVRIRMRGNEKRRRRAEAAIFGFIIACIYHVAFLFFIIVHIVKLLLRV